MILVRRWASFQSPNNHTIITSAPRERSGGASGMLGTARPAGQKYWRRAGSADVEPVWRYGTHLSLAAAIPRLAAVVSGLRITQPRVQA